jgi:hypothetical protein
MQGGYQYRLCPLHEEPTEECFRRTPVPFASKTQLLRFEDREENIAATYVSEGTTPVSRTQTLAGCCPGSSRRFRCVYG